MKPATYFSTDVQTYKTMDCSTCHVTKEECNDLLERDECPIAAYPFEYGHFVYVSLSDIDGYCKEALEFGFSESFVNLIRLAHKQGCKYLCLDCDGFVYEDLPKFSW
jgi:hypothetical protein